MVLRSGPLVVGSVHRGRCGGPTVVVLPDGSFALDGARPTRAINSAVQGFGPLIRKWADHCGLPVQVVAAVMMRESAGNPRAEGPARDHGVGLMQITHPILKAGHSTAELLDPDLNVEIGARFLARLWSRHEGNVVHVLTSYNAGSPRCAPGRNPFNLVNTADYVGGVLALANGAVDVGLRSEPRPVPSAGAVLLVLTVGGGVLAALAAAAAALFGRG